MVVKRSQAAQGHDGEQLHVHGPHMEMRVWENVPRGYHFAPHDCAVDIAGFITKGSGLWLIDGQEVTTIDFTPPAWERSSAARTARYPSAAAERG